MHFQWAYGVVRLGQRRRRENASAALNSTGSYRPAFFRPEEGRLGTTPNDRRSSSPVQDLSVDNNDVGRRPVYPRWHRRRRARSCHPTVLSRPTHPPTLASASARLNFQPSYVVVGVYRLFTGKALYKPFCRDGMGARVLVSARRVEVCG
ncbi:hypothetical protein OF83DRAFT_370723 [Amylostereum chailletii]|nr:hypothetical protein OF83DRAFT_370723 [Amylostereum chailletii]